MTPYTFNKDTAGRNSDLGEGGKNKSIPSHSSQSGGRLSPAMWQTKPNQKNHSNNRIFVASPPHN